MERKRVMTRKPLILKKRVCKFCTDKTIVIDYMNADMLSRFVSERGKILPRRITGTCARHQRELTKAIKRARLLALLPFSTVKERVGI
ncbi:MAG: 30S ribosomal protein S18 [Deltaproteobacteria bacterium]|jgi:small subunit ribosomal protein S18|nr:30S ribosomal protein S18 [Deltaproteobacteria bacterium]MCL5791475.1 30S ribosomal protein S18 [Deltaproteobacteria bacterium]